MANGRNWMFWKKKNKPEPVVEEERKPRQLTLKSTDDDVTRAVNILKASGVAVNSLTYTAIVPWMALAIKAYRELDREDWENERSGSREDQQNGG